MINLEDKQILLTGGHGFLGSHVYDSLIEEGVSKSNISSPRSVDYDLRIQDKCKEVVKDIDIVIHVAGRTGGIGYNKENPGSLFYDNIIMNTQLMEASRISGVEKFVGIGTVCSYPKYTPVPFKEEDLWNGYPEETNASYGLAKKMMIVQSQAYRQQYDFNSVNLLMVNLYGPGDDFKPESSHVIAALIKKFADAVKCNHKSVEIWGTGNVSREFLYVSDAARGIMMATLGYNDSYPVNLGSGMEISIRDLVLKLKDISGFDGEIIWDTSKPDGQPRRGLDVFRAKEKFGFEAEISFDEGLKKTYGWYLNNMI